MRDYVSNPTAPPRSNRAGALWLVQAFTGLLLTALLVLHMVAHHFVVEGGLRTFADVIAYVANPTIFFLEILFLVVVTVHAMLGLRAIVLDLNPAPSRLRLAEWGLALLGVGAVAYGVWLQLTIAAF